jgi:hypothetical protein
MRADKMVAPGQDLNVERPNIALLRAAVLILAVLLLAAGCGSSSSASSAAGSTVKTTVTQTHTVTATRTTAPPASRPGRASGLKPCVAADLALSSVGQQGGMGHGELGFTLENKGAQPCRTGGYPGVLFLDQAGRALPTAPSRSTHDFFGATPVVKIVLAPGQSASFRLGVTHAGKLCTTAAGLQVIAPNDTATLRTTIPDGAYECQAVTVSPLRPGRSAYP